MVQINNDVAIIICGHGSRNTNYKASLVKLTNELKVRFKSKNFFYCFIEIDSPLIEECLNSLIKDYKRIYFFPLFIFDGKHYKIDIHHTLSKYKNYRKIVLIDKISLLKDILPIFSSILKDQLEKGKEYYLITSCSPSNDEEVKQQLLRYTKLLSQNLGLSYYDQHFVGQESSSVSKVERIISPNGYVILHPIFFFDGFLSKKNVLFFEKIFKKNILILKPLVFYKKVKDAIEIKLLRNFEVFE